MAKKMTRRTFVKLGASSVLTLGPMHALSGCGDSNPSNKPTDNPDNVINEIPMLSTEPASVAAVKGSNLESMTRDAIDAVGGMASIVNSGETVFIKPNFVTFPWAPFNNCFRTGECTKPDILIAIAEECLKVGAQSVVIGDGSQKKSFNWTNSHTLDGQKNLVDEAVRLNNLYNGNITLSCLEVDNPCTHSIPTTIHRSGSLYISNIYETADKIISVPVAKTHRWAQLSLALKNFIGVLSIAEYGSETDGGWDRGWLHTNPNAIDHTSVTAISQAFLDIVAAQKPDLSIIDFSYCMEGNGPAIQSGGETVDVRDRLGSWLVLASKDIMAADATAARVMNHNVADIKQLVIGYGMELGQIREEYIDMIGENLSDISMNWKHADIANVL